MPDGLLMTTSGMPPLAVVEAPVSVWAPVPLIRRVAVPPPYARTWLMSPWAARVPVEVRLPPVRLVEPVAVRVVPAASAVLARKSTALSVCEPVTVPPAKTTVELGGIDGARGVRPVVAGPDRAGQGERARGLVDHDQRQRAGGGGRRAGERLGAGAGDRDGGRAPAGGERLGDVRLRGQGARAVERAGGQAEAAGGGQGRARGDRGGGPQVDRVEAVAAGDRAAREDDASRCRGRACPRCTSSCWPSGACRPG